MKEIQIFKNELFGEIRTLTGERGEPLFVGKDVAKALGYSNTRDALRKHVDTEDKTTVAICDTGSNYKSQAVVINESGLYALILSSKLPTAKAFKRWVTAKMLNRAVGGVNDSNHLDGCAADIICKDCTQAVEYAFLLIILFRQAKEQFDELFIERKGVRFWVHFAVREFNNRGKVSVYDL